MSVTRCPGSTRQGQPDGLQAPEESFWADSTPLHTHVGAEKAFYVLTGEVEARIDGTTTTATPGTILVVPRGVAHGLRRPSADPVRMLTLISPPGFEKVFEEVAQHDEEALLAEPERMVELAARYGTQVLGDYPG